ncbi:MAG: hypothetical protein OCD02_03530 [Spirochaetaceae bacterium]
MDIFYELISGLLIINKKILAKELLKRQSFLKYLLNKNKEIYRAPELFKVNDIVKINFDPGTDIELQALYIEQFKSLKQLYKEEISGKIDIRVTCNSIYTSTVDLNGIDSIEVY